MRHWEIAVDAIFPPSIETETSISPCGQLPQARYIPSLYRGAAAAAAGVAGGAGAAPVLALGLTPAVVAGAAEVSCGLPAGVFRDEAGGLGLFFFTGGAAPGVFVAGFAADGGITAAILADAVCDACESNRCAAGLVR